MFTQKEATSSSAKFFFNFKQMCTKESLKERCKLMYLGLKDNRNNNKKIQQVRTNMYFNASIK